MTMILIIALTFTLAMFGPLLWTLRQGTDGRTIRRLQAAVGEGEDAIEKLEASADRRIRLLDHIADHIGQARYRAIVETFHQLEDVGIDAILAEKPASDEDDQNALEVILYTDDDDDDEENDAHAIG